VESYQVIAGFSDIKVEFLKKTGSTKALDELHLWFTLEDGMLAVHDYDEHKICVLVAVDNGPGKEWTIFLEPLSFGYLLIEYELTTDVSINLAWRLNRSFKSNGFFSARRN
jgi:hypothetical protein